MRLPAYSLGLGALITVVNQKPQRGAVPDEGGKASLRS